MPTCLLIRHGRTASNAAGTLAGWTPGVELDAHGRDQVSALAARLAPLPVVALATSPLTRCLQTTDILRASWPAASVLEHEGLGECRYGAWTGRALADLAKDALWRVVQDQPSAAVFPDGEEHPGESIGAMAARAVAAVRRTDALVEQEHGSQAIWIAVTHGDVAKAILADAAGIHLDAFQRLFISPASVSAVRYTPHRPFVLRVNDTGSDLSAFAPPTGEPTEQGDAAVGGGR